ncbi:MULTISPECIES: hypothetical protein [unclassified Endozoicomonas]|uniref:hypothetical protein n=1 Tax=unclassified Endozoicomonas TaxID=2644528 RepID=UPI003BB5E5E5
MDLSRAEQILAELEAGSQKITKISAAVDYLDTVANQLKELSDEFKKARQHLSDSQKATEATQVEVLSHIEPAVTVLSDNQKTFQILGTQLTDKINALNSELDSTVGRAQQPLINEIQKQNKEITAQIHRDAGATQNALATQNQSLTQTLSALSQLADSHKNLQNQSANSKRWLIISVVLLVVNCIISAKGIF